MTEPVKPIRAWAEYEHWSVFLHIGDQKLYIIPSGESGTPFVASCHGVTDAAHVMNGYYSSLRSLRVLFDNGHELYLRWYPADDETGAPYWAWEIPVHGQTNNTWPHGQFEDDKDHEAVERAMIAAAAVFNPTYTPD